MMMSREMTTYQGVLQDPHIQSSLRTNDFYYTTSSNVVFHDATAGVCETSLQHPQSQSYSLPQRMNPHDRLNRFQSTSIPISPSGLQRTASENELSEDAAKADYKDYLFYNRLVNGISSRQRFLQDGTLKHENLQCLENIVKTRHDEDEAAAAAATSDYYWYYPPKDYDPPRSNPHETDRLVPIHNITSGTLFFAVPNPANHDGTSSDGSPVDEECIFDLEL
jgi:hypothetical protein